MMILTDEETKDIYEEIIWECSDSVSLVDVLKFAEKFEAAIMAKLASAELPEPAMEQMLSIGTKFSSENWGERSFNEIDFYSAACEIFKLGQAQAYAQGAAAQLAKEPTAIMWQHDETGRVGFLEAWGPVDMFKESNPRLRIVASLYTRRQA